MISAASPRGVLRGESALKSKFQNDCVRNDIRSSLLKSVEEKAHDVDVFVLDLVDERLGVYELAPGTYITQTWELEESKLLQQQEKKPRLIKFGTDEHFELWTNAATEVLAAIKKTRKPLIVLAPDWAEEADDGQKLVYRSEFSAAHNRRYERYIGFLRDQGCRVVSPGQEVVKASTKHQWGLAPFHYTEAVYHEMRDAIAKAVKR